MAKIKYVGTSNWRELLVADLKKWEIDIEEMLRFKKHDVVEVEDDVADAILKNLPAEFEVHTEQAKSDAPVATGQGAQAVNSTTDPSAAASSS